MTTSNPAHQAVHDFIEQFNRQDHQALAGTLIYPHVRLAAGRFVTIDSAVDFAAMSARNESRLRDQGWDHTTVDSIETIQQGPDKAHVRLHVSRRDASGNAYHDFDTLWIATCVEGHWGIQFRSSFLEG